jgi:hypothetical protein
LADALPDSNAVVLSNVFMTSATGEVRFVKTNAKALLSPRSATGTTLEANVSAFVGIVTEKVRPTPPTYPDIRSVNVPDKQPLAATPHAAALTTENVPPNCSLRTPAVTVAGAILVAEKLNVAANGVATLDAGSIAVTITGAAEERVVVLPVRVTTSPLADPVG